MMGARVAVKGTPHILTPDSDTFLGVQGAALKRAEHKGAKGLSDEDEASTDDDDPDD